MYELSDIFIFPFMAYNARPVPIRVLRFFNHL